jgi:hypothetical protein
MFPLRKSCHCCYTYNMNYNSIRKCGHRYFVYPHRALSMATGILSLISAVHIYANLKQDSFLSKQITSLSLVSMSWCIGWNCVFRHIFLISVIFSGFTARHITFLISTNSLSSLTITNLILRIIRRIFWIICVRCITRIILENARKFFSDIPPTSHIVPQTTHSNTAVLANNMTTFSGVKVSNQPVSLNM